MKKQQQRRINKRKNKTVPVLFQQTPIGDFFRSLVVVGINILADALSQPAPGKQAQDEELKYCRRCQVHYTDRCNCDQKKLPAPGHDIT